MICSIFTPQTFKATTCARAASVIIRRHDLKKIVCGEAATKWQNRQNFRGLAAWRIKLLVATSVIACIALMLDCAEKQNGGISQYSQTILTFNNSVISSTMGDPLSVTASIVALLQLTQAVVHGLNGMKDASKERISIRDEIIYVSGLLYNLKGQVTRSEIWSGIISSLGCPRGPLEQLKEALEQLTMRLSPAEGLRKVGKSIAWPFQKGEVEVILRKIERQKMHIVLAIENNHMKLLIR